MGRTGDYGRLGLLMVTEKNRNERKIRGMVTKVVESDEEIEKRFRN